MTSEKPRYHRTLDTILLMSIALFMIGNVIRIQHWIGEIEILILGMTATGSMVISMMIYFFRNRNQNLNQSIGFIIVLQVISLQQYKFLKIPVPEGFVPLLFITGFAWIILYLFSMVRNKAQINAPSLLLILGVVFFIGEMAFKYFRVPFSFFPFFLGCIFCMTALSLRLKKVNTPDIP